jgi:hypothetical protein
MSKKPTGLIGTAMVETDAKRAQRESFIDGWRYEHQELARRLNALSKAQLIDLYVDGLAEAAYDIAATMSSVSGRIDEALMKNIAYVMLKGTPDDKRNAVLVWCDAAVASAGGDINEVRRVERITGDTLARIELNRFKKGLKTDEGRLKGGDVRRQQSEEYQRKLTKAIEDFLKNPTTANWSDSRIARYIIDKGLNVSDGITRKETALRAAVAKVRESYISRQSG